MAWGQIIGAGIGAASSLLGGLFGNSAAKKQAAQQREYQENQLQYMVRDAKKAGISPLAALGQGDYARPLASQGNPLGEGIANAGAALGRGVAGIQRKQVAQLGVERAGLENDLLRAQIQNLKKPSPIPGQSRPRSASAAIANNATQDNYGGPPVDAHKNVRLPDGRVVQYSSTELPEVEDAIGHMFINWLQGNTAPIPKRKGRVPRAPKLVNPRKSRSGYYTGDKF